MTFTAFRVGANVSQFQLALETDTDILIWHFNRFSQKFVGNFEKGFVSA